jgi:hypothetical protein
MEIGNFRLLEVGAVKKGEVQVTTGFLWWKRTEWREVFLPEYSELWRWADTGEFTPMAVANRALAARHNRVG